MQALAILSCEILTMIDPIYMFDSSKRIVFKDARVGPNQVFNSSFEEPDFSYIYL